MRIHMSDAEVALFRRELAASKSYLEFGMGGSTALAASLGIRTVSVESDRNWIDKTRREIVAASGSDALLKCYLADIGPTKELGLPKSGTPEHSWASYYLGVWKLLDGAPDFVLIDGRFRTACAIVCALSCPATTRIAVHDFRDGLAVRINYEKMVEFLDIVEQAQTLFVFRPKANLDRIRALAVLFEVCGDPW